jgi:hypothetical protein
MTPWRGTEMGRSVSHLTDATAVAYWTHEPDEDYYREQYEEEMLDTVPEERVQFDTYMWDRWNYEDSQYEWDSSIESVREALQERWPSLEDADEWHDEVHIIAQNAHSVVGISEYNGFVSLSLAPRYDRSEYWRAPDDNLGAWWREKVAPKFLTLFSEYEKIGTASNGEGFYRKTKED